MESTAADAMPDDTDLTPQAPEPEQPLAETSGDTSADPADRIIVALDGMAPEQALRFAGQVEGLRWVKVGLELFVQAGPCLLYTSPSPRDKRQSRMPSSA